MPSGAFGLQRTLRTSDVLAELVAEAPADRISLGWIAERLQTRSFGLLTLVLAIVGLTPGIASVSGFLLAIPALQMIFGRETFALPRFLQERTISRPVFVKLCSRIVSVFRFIERFARRRLQLPPWATTRLVGLAQLLLCIAIIQPLPFAYIVPTLAIIPVSFAYLEEDGVLLWISLTLAFAALAVTAALIWGAIRAAGFLIAL